MYMETSSNRTWVPHFEKKSSNRTSVLVLNPATRSSPISSPLHLSIWFQQSKDAAIDLKRPSYFSRWWIDLRFVDVGEVAYWLLKQIASITCEAGHSVETRLSSTNKDGNQRLAAWRLDATTGSALFFFMYMLLVLFFIKKNQIGQEVDHKASCRIISVGCLVHLVYRQKAIWTACISRER
jgi:hypothetical protein